MPTLEEALAAVTKQGDTVRSLKAELKQGKVEKVCAGPLPGLLRCASTTAGCTLIVYVCVLGGGARALEAMAVDGHGALALRACLHACKHAHAHENTLQAAVDAAIQQLQHLKLDLDAATKVRSPPRLRACACTVQQPASMRACAPASSWLLTFTPPPCTH